MNMPGFNAEVSLTATKAPYPMALRFATGQSKVSPQSLHCTQVGFGCEQCTYCAPGGRCIDYVHCP
jgi:hypothetical protein